MNKNKIKLIGGFFVLATALTLSTRNAFANGYGGEEEYNTKFRIVKEVRIAGDSEWKDKVTDVGKDDVVEFRIKIKNKSDGDAGDADDMEMKDHLPDEMEKIGGSGLTEDWDDFDPDDTKEFIILAKVKSDEYDRDVRFEKCVVNKADLRWDGDFQGSDTATVCYGNMEPSELPKTGSISVFALAGAGSLLAGVLSKRFLKRK
ncbi:MAG TPA: LPXTG cell wall anchor domain-containing protein [bacterium]|jgi:LPXTG-motif cell wall-anchored protein|nr:LPXTG cell wall anchor domain-containing protein [bacterium]